jgi:gliding motility-associated-like protein
VVINSIDSLNLGVYQLKVVKSDCATSYAFANLQFEAAPQPVDLGNDTVLCPRNTFLLDAFHESAINYEWSDGTTNPQLIPESAGFYAVTVTYPCGQAVDNIQIDFKENCFADCPLYAPNAFSPNYDGVNDEWSVASPCDAVFFDLKIFNRWGALVFNTNDIDQAWDGTFNGRMAQQGLYTWITSCTFRNDFGEEFDLVNKGHVVLLQ